MNRVVPLLVATSLVAPSLLEARHAALSPHVACPVDGQIEDAREQSPGMPHSHSTGVLLPATEASAHAHRPCECTPAARQRSAALAARSTDTSFTDPIRAPKAPPNDARPSTVELYLLAPKLSPPLS